MLAGERPRLGGEVAGDAQQEISNAGRKRSFRPHPERDDHPARDPSGNLRRRCLCFGSAGLRPRLHLSSDRAARRPEPAELGRHSRRARLDSRDRGFSRSLPSVRGVRARRLRLEPADNRLSAGNGETAQGAVPYPERCRRKVCERRQAAELHRRQRDLLQAAVGDSHARNSWRPSSIRSRARRSTRATSCAGSGGRCAARTER